MSLDVMVGSDNGAQKGESWRTPWILTLTGASLFIAGGLTPYALEAGPLYNPVSGISLLSGLTVALGIVIAVGSTLGLSVRRSRHQPSTSHTPTHVGIATVSVGSVVLVAFLMLSLGWLPGWYDPSSGSRGVEVTGCGGFPPAIYPTTFPDGFPPGSVVNFHWDAQNGTLVKFLFTEDPPRGGAPNPNDDYESVGSSGNFSASGSGGEWAFEASNYTSCPTKESVTLNWTYTLTL